MTAAVPLIHAATVAMLTGIMVEQTGESEGREGWGRGVEMDRRPRMSGGGGGGNWTEDRKKEEE